VRYLTDAGQLGHRKDSQSNTSAANVATLSSNRDSEVSAQNLFNIAALAALMARNVGSRTAFRRLWGHQWWIRRKFSQYQLYAMVLMKFPRADGKACVREIPRHEGRKGAAHLKTHHQFERWRMCLRGLSGARDAFLLAARAQNLRPQASKQWRLLPVAQLAGAM
jgi:hypothetical protein